MNITDRFSITDFLAYFFPGAFSLLGLYVLLLLTPFKIILLNVQGDLIAALVFLSCSYVCGIMFSAFSKPLVVLYRTIQKTKDNARWTIPLEKLEANVLEAFRAIFDVSKKTEINWSSDHFYLCRTLVIEKMPNSAQKAARQNDLRQLRENLLASITVWLIAGIVWGIHLLVQGVTLNGIVLIIVSVVFYLITINMVIHRLYLSETREVRDILIAFIAGYKIGLFQNNKYRSHEYK